MEILGVGPTELIFIIVIALIVLGPKDLAKTGSTIGKWLNSFVQSDGWKAIRKTSDELRRLPTQLMREDNLKNFLTPEDINQQKEDRKQDLSFLPREGAASLPASENTIHPPQAMAAKTSEEAKPALIAEEAKPAPKKSPSKPRKQTTSATKKTTPVKKKTVKPAARKKPNA
jgi:sec-independent protein translocase protein TatB